MKRTATLLPCALLVSGATALSMEPLADPSAARVAGGMGPKKYYGGAGVGRLTLDEKAGQENQWKCRYDMVLCERIQGRPPTEGGLFVPQDDLPRLHLCKVVSMGPGREEENGNVVPMPDIKVGDVVVAKVRYYSAG